MDNKVAIIGHSFIERLEESLGSGDFPFGKNLGVEGSEIRYFGLRGAISKSLLHSSDMTKCERFRPNKIFIQIGGNDINGDSTVTSVCESIQNLIEHLCKLDSVNDIIVGSIFQRRNPRGLTSETFNCEASKINNFLERFYRNYTRVHFWRLRGLQKPKWDIFLADGVHLNKDAALIYASKVLKKKFNLEVSIRDIERIVRCEDMVIQTVLLKLKTKIERAMWEINDQRAKARHYESEKPEADQLVGSTQKGKQGKSMKGGPSPRPEPGTSGPRSRLNQYSDNNESVSRPMYEEKYQESLAKEETIKILEAKIKRLEHLIHLKDVRIDDLQYRIETMRPTGLKR